jgi:hypothetical protein
LKSMMVKYGLKANQGRVAILYFQYLLNMVAENNRHIT